MAIETTFFWYCRPLIGGVWSKSAFGAYTPCAIDSLVLSISHMLLLALCIYRIWLIFYKFKSQRFCFKSNIFNYLLSLLATYFAFEPLFKLIAKISIFNLDAQQHGFAPFEVVNSMIRALTWGSMLVMLLVETKAYIFQFRWAIRFGVVYALVAKVVMLNLILSVKDLYKRHILCLYIIEVFFQALFGVLLLAYFPSLVVPYNGGTDAITNELVDGFKNEELVQGEHICPERHANLYSKMTFLWMNHIMKIGYKRPLTEKDVWKLDTWDQTETLCNRFQKTWEEECKKSKPSLLRALHNSFGGRFWFGGLWKIGNDVSQFVGPFILNKLLESMQRGDPSRIGYVHAFSIFVGVLFGVFCEAQYLQNVMRVGFRLRSVLVASIFRKSMRLTHEDSKKFGTGKITNLMTSDTATLECYLLWEG